MMVSYVGRFDKPSSQIQLRDTKQETRSAAIQCWRDAAQKQQIDYIQNIDPIAKQKLNNFSSITSYVSMATLVVAWRVDI